jgi:peptide/nickel transport system ATP-binding protein
MTRPADAVVRAEDLSIARAGERVIDGVTVRLAAGGALAVMGGTGSGKSTLAAVLAGLDDPELQIDGGRAEVHGVDLRARGRRLRVRRFLTGHLPQGAGAALPARLTVSEVITEPIVSRDRRVNQRALSLRVAGLLDELHLPIGAASKYPYELSSGMRQRVALARALVLDPKLFVGDEPYGYLDVEVRGAARDALLRRQSEAGMALVLVTNDETAIAEIDADVLVLQGGRTVAYGHGTAGLLWTPGADGRRAS